MANLLPLEYKRKNRAEYLLRMATVALCATTLIVFSNLILLVPSYVRALSQEGAAEARLAHIESGDRKDSALVSADQDPSTRLAKINEKANLFFRAIQTEGTGTTPTEVILEIISLKSASIKILGITYDKTAGRGREKFVVSGVALRRDDLSQFVEAIKKTPSFTKVELPISSYVKSTNINFSLVLERIVTTSGKETL